MTAADSTETRLNTAISVQICQTALYWTAEQNQSGVCLDPDLIHDNICFLTFAGGYSMQRKRPTRQVISSGWDQTAGAQRSLQLCTKRRWQREQSPFCPSVSPSKVQWQEMGLVQTSYLIVLQNHGKYSFRVTQNCMCLQKKKSCFVMPKHYHLIIKCLKTSNKLNWTYAIFRQWYCRIQQRCDSQIVFL